MLVTITVCDVCQDSTRPATRYTVSTQDRSGETDRCDEHAAELEAVLENDSSAANVPPERKTDLRSRPEPKTAAQAPRRSRRPRVVDMSEVERARR